MPQRVAAHGDPFVDVDDEGPVRVGKVQRVVARDGEVVGPVEMVHLGAGSLRQIGGGVRRSRVEHDHAIHPGRTLSRHRAMQRASLRTMSVAAKRGRGLPVE